MCQSIIQFCTNSTRELMFVASIKTLVFAIGLIYFAFKANSLYVDINPSLAQNRNLVYHLHLAGSVHLIIISVFGCFAAYYNDKHSIRALAIFSSLNFLLALAAILLIPAGGSVENDFKNHLLEAKDKYDFTLKRPNVTSSSNINLSALDNLFSATRQQTANQTNPPTRQRRMADEQVAMNSTIATKLWDDLQDRGCCGFNNAADWGAKLPKSCCAQPVEETNHEFVCKSVDDEHKQACIELIGSTGFYNKNMFLVYVLALIAVVSLIMANVTVISAYRTYHYDEASQNAYN